MNKFITFEEFLPKIQKELYESTNNTFDQQWVKFKYTRGKEIPYDHTRTKSFNKMVALYEMYIVQMFSRDYPAFTYGRLINKLNEGLTLSSSIDKTINIISKNLPDSIEFNIGEIPSSKSTIIIGLEMYESDYTQYKDKIDHVLNVCGYYIGNIQQVKSGSDKIVFLEIEPKFLYNCTKYIYDHTNSILYHVTLGALYNKIKNNGLIPKSKNKKTIHPDRIYMIEPGNYTINNFIQVANNLYKTNNGTFRKNVEKYVNDNKLNVVVLKINLNKQKEFQYEIFKDPNHPNGLFVYGNIHPKCVDILYEFDI